MITVSSLIHSWGGCSPPSPTPPGSNAYDCSCFFTFVGYYQASFILATLLQVFLVNFAASYRTVSLTLFRILHITLAALAHSCSCHGFVLYCQHGSSLDLLDNPPSFCQPSSDRLPRSTTLRYCKRSLLSQVHVFTLVKIM